MPFAFDIYIITTRRFIRPCGGVEKVEKST